MSKRSIIEMRLEQATIAAESASREVTALWDKIKQHPAGKELAPDAQQWLQAVANARGFLDETALLLEAEQKLPSALGSLATLFEGLSQTPPEHLPDALKRAAAALQTP